MSAGAPPPGGPSPTTKPVRRHRRALIATVALAAAGGGAAIAWRQRHPASGGEKAEAVAAMWAMRFERPAGGELAMQGLRGRPLLLNFWATWCPPCVEEMPLLDRFGRDQAGAGWQVMGLAIDRAEPVRGFLARRPVGYAIALGGADGLGLAQSLGNRAGGLPYSAVFDRAGRLVRTHAGAVREADLAAWVEAVG